MLSIGVRLNMLNTFVRYVVLMMLVVFVGQAVAFDASSACKMTSSFDTSIENSLQSTSENVDADDADCCDTNCCDVGCSCVGGSCSSIVYLHTEFQKTQIIVSKMAEFNQQVLYPNTMSSTLFRPPIFIT